MTPGKRAFDVILAALLAVILLPLLVLLLLLILLIDGQPLFYISERMKTPTRGFQFWKLRTMTVVDNNSGVSGGDKAARITRMGRFLRKSHLDELPQLWNILKGDMSFVGPRPPLRGYVEKFPELYAKILQSRPGVTGLATITYRAHEHALISRCTTARDTEDVYVRRCIPVKARLDAIYQKRRTFCFDLLIMLKTFGK